LRWNHPDRLGDPAGGSGQQATDAVSFLLKIGTYRNFASPTASVLIRPASQT
jgi:hypothetical protein